MDPSMGDFTMQLIDPLGNVYTNEGIGEVGYSTQAVLPKAFSPAAAFDLSPNNRFMVESDDVDCCDDHDEHERLASLSHLPYIEPIIPEMSPAVAAGAFSSMAVAPNATTASNIANMTVVSLGSGGLVVTNPIPGEWQFIVTSNNLLNNAVFAVGIAEKPQSVMSWLLWDATTIYVGGEIVMYDGQLYQARWWTHNDKPDGQNAQNPWRHLGDALYMDWRPDIGYVAGSIVLHNGQFYEAIFWAAIGEEPGVNPWGAWRPI
jgi:hypothetical protein